MKRTLMKSSLFTHFVPQTEKWFFSMLEYGMKENLISLSQVENVQISIMKIMSENILKYTKGKSTSVKTDVGIDLFNGIVYTIDAYFRSFENIDEAFEKLLTFNVTEFYEEGKKNIVKNLGHLEASYKYLKSMYLKVDIEAYNDTIFKGLSLFFKAYDHEFMPNITSGMIDYPLFYDSMKESGLWYIDYYVKTLNLENDFCHQFDEKAIIEIISRYAKKYDMGPEDLIVNISEIVIKQATASNMLQRNVKNLFLNQSDIALLHEKLKGHNAPEVFFKEAFDESVERLMPSAKTHFMNGIAPLLSEYKLALASGNLAHFFII